MEGKDQGRLDGDSPAEGGEGAEQRELTTREVNRAETARLKNEKALHRLAKRRKFVGVWTRIGAEAVNKRKSPMAQADYVFAHVTVQSIHGTERPVSEGTLDKMHKSIVLAYRELTTLPEGRGVHSILQFRRVHAVALVKHWKARGLSNSTIACRVSDLRTWLDRLGKPDTIPTGPEWEAVLRKAGVDMRELRRSTVAMVARDWASNGVDVEAVIEKVWEECPVVGAQLLMQLHFGARVREGYSCNPFLDVKGDQFFFQKGAKGGRARSIDLDPDPEIRAKQLAVLERVRAVAEQHPRRHLARKGDTAKQTRNHFYYTLRKLGITMAKLGVTAHGLRHQYLQQRYSGLTGLPAPVHNAVPASSYRELEQREKAARQLTSEEAGHWRPDISAAYLSSVPALERRQKQNMLATLALVQDREDVDRLFQDFGARAIYFTGKAAEGLDLPPDYRYGLTVLAEHDKSAAERLALTTQLEALTGKPFAIAIGQSECDVPSDRLEATLLSHRNPTPRSGI